MKNQPAPPGFDETEFGRVEPGFFPMPEKNDWPKPAKTNAVKTTTVTKGKIVYRFCCTLPLLY
jgi:hypothetical protein